MAGGSTSVSSTKDMQPKPLKTKRNWSPNRKKSISLMAAGQPSAPSPNSDQCPGCNGSHQLRNCPVFKGLTVDGRYDVVSKHRLCMACFSSHHWSNKC